MTASSKALATLKREASLPSLDLRPRLDQIIDAPIQLHGLFSSGRNVQFVCHFHQRSSQCRIRLRCLAHLGRHAFHPLCSSLEQRHLEVLRLRCIGDRVLGPR